MVDENMAVTVVVPESGAGKAGVQLGDIIVTLDAAAVTDLYDLRGLLADRAVGDEVELGIRREGEELMLNVTLGQLD